MEEIAYSTQYGLQRKFYRDHLNHNIRAALLNAYLAEPAMLPKHVQAQIAQRGLERTIFELQSVDWCDHSKTVPASTLVQQMRLLQRLGAVNFGYYPDDFIGNHPQAKALHRGISLQTYPYRP